MHKSIKCVIFFYFGVLDDFMFASTMTNPANSQSSGSFSVDMEWKGTNLDDTMACSRVALVSTGATGDYIGIFASKYNADSYKLVAECCDAFTVLSLDLGQYNKDKWYRVTMSWLSDNSTMSVQVYSAHFEVTASFPFGSISSRSFYFGSDGTTSGGGFMYKYVRFHQDVLRKRLV
jgi:hypothetical protein